jgi:hypothetical protein
MILAFKKQWGSREAGTVATEHLMEGEGRRSKGIHILDLAASFLDPRFKFGPGFDKADKSYTWNYIKSEITNIARMEEQL